MTLPTGIVRDLAPCTLPRGDLVFLREASSRVAAAGMAANVALWVGALMPVWSTARRAAADERPEVKTLWWLVLVGIVVMAVAPAVAQEQSKFKLLATNRTGTMQRELDEAPPEFNYCAGMTVLESMFARIAGCSPGRS